MRRTHLAAFLHFIWGTWDRLPLLTAEIAEPVHRAIGAKCAELGAEVIAIGGVEDHLHLLVHLPATLTLADLMKHAKGASSHLVNYRLTGGGSFRWQGSYAAYSVEPSRVAQVAAYIAHQRDHHADNTLIADWEPPPDDDEQAH